MYLFCVKTLSVLSTAVRGFELLRLKKEQSVYWLGNETVNGTSWLSGETEFGRYRVR